MTVGQLLSVTSSRELGEWMAFFMIEQKHQQRRDMDLKAKSGAQAVTSRLRGR